MLYTELGGTGLRISKIGFGGIPIRRLGKNEAVPIVRRAVDLGVTFFDTARSYGDSEEKIGEGIRGVRDKVVLASKTNVRNKKDAAEHIEQSLRALGTDYIDLYQLHNVSKESVWQEVSGPDGALEALYQAREAGKIGHIGISSHSHDLAVKFVKTGLFETLMVPFSFLEPEAAERELPLCRELNVGFICMKPFSGGALDTATQCLMWVLREGVSVAIPGISSMAELEEDVAIADVDWSLSAHDVAVMEQAKAQLGKAHCRRCEYCQPCSVGIPISEILMTVSLLRRQGPDCMKNGRFERVVATVESCVKCRECEPRCPYGLPIPELLQQRVDEIRGRLRDAGWAV